MMVHFMQFVVYETVFDMRISFRSVNNYDHIGINLALAIVVPKPTPYRLNGIASIRTYG